MVQQLSWRGKVREFVATSIIGNVLVLDQNPKRVYALFINDSGNVMYLSKSDAAVVNSGIRLNANGGSYEINFTNPYFGSVALASAAAGDLLLVTEVE
jgi:hypothetical protein